MAQEATCRVQRFYGSQRERQVKRHLGCRPCPAPVAEGGCGGRCPLRRQSGMPALAARCRNGGTSMSCRLGGRALGLPALVHTPPQCSQRSHGMHRSRRRSVSNALSIARKEACCSCIAWAIGGVGSVDPLLCRPPMAQSASGGFRRTTSHAAQRLASGPGVHIRLRRYVHVKRQVSSGHLRGFLWNLDPPLRGGGAVHAALAVTLVASRRHLSRVTTRYVAPRSNGPPDGAAAVLAAILRVLESCWGLRPGAMRRDPNQLWNIVCFARNCARRRGHGVHPFMHRSSWNLHRRGRQPSGALSTCVRESLAIGVDFVLPVARHGPMCMNMLGRAL